MVLYSQRFIPLLSLSVLALASCSSDDGPLNETNFGDFDAVCGGTSQYTTLRPVAGSRSEALWWACSGSTNRLAYYDGTSLRAVTVATTERLNYFAVDGSSRLWALSDDAVLIVAADGSIIKRIDNLPTLTGENNRRFVAAAGQLFVVRETETDTVESLRADGDTLVPAGSGVPVPLWGRNEWLLWEKSRCTADGCTPITLGNEVTGSTVTLQIPDFLADAGDGTFVGLSSLWGGYSSSQGLPLSFATLVRLTDPEQSYVDVTNTKRTPSLQSVVQGHSSALLAGSYSVTSDGSTSLYVGAARLKGTTAAKPTLYNRYVSGCTINCSIFRGFYVLGDGAVLVSLNSPTGAPTSRWMFGKLE